MKLDEKGIHVDDWQTIVDRRVNGLKEIYGDDIDLSQNTPDGQRVGIESKMELDLQQFGLYTYTEFDPDLASSNGLRVLGKLNGITRAQETHSKWDIKIVTDRNITIRDGFSVRDNINQKWVAKQQLLIAGDNIVTFDADLAGAVSGGTSVNIETMLIGIISASPYADIVVGKQGETVDEFRLRRKETIANSAQSIMGSLVSGLFNVEDVTDVAVYENDQDEDDPLTNLPPNSIYCVVEGGSIVDITERIAKNKPVGVRTSGGILGIWEETINAGGRDFTYNHEMYFDRPTYVDVYVRLNATRQNVLEPIDVERIKMQVSSIIKHIGETVQAGELYKYSYTDVSGYIVTDLEIMTGSSTWTDSFLQPAINERFIFKPENVDVTVI